MKYSGNQAPKLEWLREDEVLSNAEDKNQIGMATQTVDIKVTADMDQNTFICRAVLGEMVEDCTLHFEVKCKFPHILLNITCLSSTHVIIDLHIFIL